VNFELPETHQLLRDTVRDFAEGEIGPVAPGLDEREEFSVELTRKMGDLGLFGIVVSPEYSGQGLDYLAYVVSCEEVARVDGSQAATVTAGNSLGIAPIYYHGTEDQKQRLLPALCRGESLWAFGLTEPGAGSDSGGTATRAVAEGEEWVINGSKVFITNGSSPITAGVTVQAVTDGKGDNPELSCFLVESGTPGLVASAMHGKLMWRASDTGELSFSDCRVPAGAMLGDRGRGHRIMLEALDTGRLGIAALGLGAAQGAFELALAYAKERKQFGQVIGSFQGVSFPLAELAARIEACRTFLYQAAWLRDNDKPFRRQAAMAKLLCSELASDVTDAAIQVHGGYGLMQETGVERFWRDQRILRIGEGTSEIQKLVIGRELGLG
jgi:alkylation response protein AidB-like acyl-CoA dehydrogenase